ncbi:MAG TPA: ABC transporter ATP-binding protein [Saprospiraceae bacterium]|nr:ABC transporter ATP-binding protein [Saprospiraceae bacterium]
MDIQTPIITMRDLRKSYGSKEVLHGIDLEITSGQVVGYIGPNGAGKSTTVRILAGLDNQFEGEVTVRGKDIRTDALEIKRHIGYIPEQTEIYDVLTPREFLQMLGRLQGMEEELIQARMQKMLSYFGMDIHIDDRMDTFSKGMRQKVLLVSGLLHNPEIIFMDEPLSGLDANTVILVKEIIQQLAAQGKTIIYCSHIMDTVEKISDRIVLIADGNVVADGPIETLRREEGDTLEAIFSNLTGQSGFNEKASDFMRSFD